MALSLIIQRRLTPQMGGLVCSGIPGRFAPEWVADLERNTRIALYHKKTYIPMPIPTIHSYPSGYGMITSRHNES